MKNVVLLLATMGCLSFTVGCSQGIQGDFDLGVSQVSLVGHRGLNDEVLVFSVNKDKLTWTYAKGEKSIRGSFQVKLTGDLLPSELLTDSSSGNQSWSITVCRHSLDGTRVANVKDSKGLAELARFLFAKDGLLESTVTEIETCGFFEKDSMIYDLIYEAEGN